MINSIDINLVRSMCDKANLATTVDNDGDLYLLLNADQDYGHNVIVFFSVTDNKWLRTFAMTDMEIPQNRLGDAMVRVNRYNEKNYLMKAYITENGRLFVERNELIDENVSEEFVINNCVKIFPPAAWSFFKEYFGNF